MRLIDADEFRKRIDHYPPDIRDIAKKELRYVKTIDAEPVIRCKDCVHSYEDLHSRVCSYGAYVDCDVSDDFFCAYGERREK